MELLKHLGKDTLPEKLLREFVDWCVWEQARPALEAILTKTGMITHATNISRASDLVEFSIACENAATHAHEASKNTGPLGLSTAEATSFLAQKMAKAAMADPHDVEAIAFYMVQLVGWQGFAMSDFLNPSKKVEAESEASALQESKLQELWKVHNPQQNNSASTKTDS
ncbi:MAG: hypothetical protein Q9P01_19010 [Anaerolineae bacterium]|nr:hypothetical protein [Anaerolineae bacterium]